MPLDMLRYCTKETLDGLAYLHSNALVHEDLRVTLQFLVLYFILFFTFMTFVIIIVVIIVFIVIYVTTSVTVTQWICTIAITLWLFLCSLYVACSCNMNLCVVLLASYILLQCQSLLIANIVYMKL